MMKKIVKCDSCGMGIAVPQRNGEPFRIIHCPNCNHQLRVVFNEPRPADDGGTVYGGGQATKPRQQPPADDGSTVLASQKAANTVCLRCGNLSYALRNGLNIVGRSAPTSEANVQIQTDDHYMSRQHAKIKLTRVADGHLKALISNYKNKHATLVGGQELLKDDELVLTHGISVRMGNTTLVYYEE